MRFPLNLRMRGMLKKEFIQIVNDPSSLLITFFMPILLTFLFGFAMSSDITKVRLGLVASNYSSANFQSLLGFFKGSNIMDLKVISDNKNDVIPLLERGEISGIIIVPQDFDKKIDSKGLAEINLITDATEPNTASMTEGYINGALELWRQDYALKHGLSSGLKVSILNRVWYNEALKSVYLLGAGSIAMVLSLVGTLLTSLVIAREWERGTMESLIASPLRIHEIAICKTVPYVILGIGSLLVSFISVLVFFQVPFRGSIPLFLLLGTIYIVTCALLGLYISITTKSQFNASQISILISFLPVMMLSGLVYETESMPKVVQLLTYVFPASYFVAIIKTIFLIGNTQLILIGNTFGICVIMIIVIIQIVRKIKKSLE